MRRAPSLRESTVAAFSRAAFWVIPALAFQVLLSAVFELSHGRFSPLLVAQLAILAVLSGAAWLLRSRPAALALVLVPLVVSVAALAVVRYGPLAGSGAYMIVACVLGVALLSPRRGIAASAFAVIVFAAIGASMVAGALPRPLAELSDFAEASAWIRIGLGLTVAMGFVIAFFLLIQRDLDLVLARAAEDRARALAADREREAAFAALSSTQRLASVAQLAGGFAHDVRNVLSVVRGNARALRDHPEDAAEIAGDMELAVSACLEASRDLLGFVRDAQPGSCRPDEVLAGLGRMLSSVLPPGIELRLEAASSAPVPLEKGELTRALLNLVLNARDAMPGGGQLTVRARNGPEGEVVLEVVDTGAGMDAQTRERAFEPFFTTKPEGLGTGLGLPMVRRAAERAGGRAELESTPGRGTRVRLILPRAENGAAPTDLTSRV